MTCRVRPIILSLAIAFGLFFPLSASVQATPVYYNNSGVDDNGNEYAAFVISHIGSTYQLELDIKVLSTYTGNKWTDVVGSVALKDFIDEYSNPSLVSAPGGASNWFLSSQELKAKGFGGGEGNGRLGAGANEPSFYGAPFNASSGPGVLSWIFQFDSTDSLNSTAQIKYLYVNSNDKKVGSLGSWDIPIQTQTPVPEPSTLLLLGSALIGLFGFRKKFRK